MLWRGERSKFRAVRLSWSVPGQHPILEGEEYKVAGLPLSIAGHQLGDTRRFKIGWELRAPKTFPELRGLELTDDAGMICLVSADSVAFAPL
jgi:hypothetical protein